MSQFEVHAVQAERPDFQRQKLYEGGVRHMCAAGLGGVLLWKGGREDCG